MINREIAELLNRMGDLLEIKDENIFKVRAYRKAARVINSLAEDIAQINAQGKLCDIPGIGEVISKDIDEYIKTGKMNKLELLEQTIPLGIFEMLSISGLGPKTVALIHKELGISDLIELEQAIQLKKLYDLPGMGQKKVENIYRAIQLHWQNIQRMNIGQAYPLVKEIINNLKQIDEIDEISPAGSFRRMRETIGNIDIIVSVKNIKNSRKIIQQFTQFPIVDEILNAGDTKGAVRTEENLQIDLRVVEQDSFGAALQYFTGSKEHNVHLHKLARKNGLKINEYGVFKGNDKIAGKTEKDIYATMKLPFIPPEIREDSGEIEAGLENRLPKLINLSDIQGEFHVHSDWSDGYASIEEMVQTAKNRGYKFIAITDHSVSLHVGRGLALEKIREQIQFIRKISEQIKGITVFAGSEVDIRSDGTLDFPDEILRELDIVIASIHSGFKKDAQSNTNRIVNAMRNPYVNIIGHPTGRIVNGREPYAVNLDEIMRVAAETGTILEINSFYHRLDLKDIHARKAGEMGLLLAIDTDSHHPEEYWQIELGVGVARRAWLEPSQILNTRSVKEIREIRKNKIIKLVR